jgi:GH24 family phage-related lysozyme (muramidase)
MEMFVSTALPISPKKTAVEIIKENINEFDDMEWMSIDGIIMLAKHEGYEPKAYPCPRGFITIGFGCNLSCSYICKLFKKYNYDVKKLKNKTQSIEESDAVKILKEVIYIAVGELKRNYKCFSTLAPELRDVLINLWFPYGLPEFMTQCKKLVTSMKNYNNGGGSKEDIENNIMKLSIYTGMWNKRCDDLINYVYENA